MSPLYAWERSTWDRHPFRATNPTADIAGVHTAFHSLSLSLSVSVPDHGHRAAHDISTPTSGDTYTRRTPTANRKLNSRQRAHRACSQLRGARGARNWTTAARFSTPVVRFLERRRRRGSDKNWISFLIRTNLITGARANISFRKDTRFWSGKLFYEFIKRGIPLG